MAETANREEIILPIDPDRLLSLAFPEIRQRYTWRDCAIYALSLGCGLDPVDEEQLKFVDETKIQALPGMATVLGRPGFWARDLNTGIDWRSIVNGEQSVTWQGVFAPEGEVVARTRIVELVDKGQGRGALITTEKILHDSTSGDQVATVRQTIFCRSDGGFGGSPKSAVTLSATPDGEPNQTVAVPTSPQLALIHRLCGDLNPLHSDPDAARRAGFDRPILHGVATFGLAHRALLVALCGNDPSRLAGFSCRFSAPVLPGDAILVDIWRLDSSRAAFRARVEGREATVLTHGSAVVR